MIFKCGKIKMELIIMAITNIKSVRKIPGRNASGFFLFCLKKYDKNPLIKCKGNESLQRNPPYIDLTGTEVLYESLCLSFFL